eukprot:3962433-Pleurochrysis_carterae.AAC.1
MAPAAGTAVGGTAPSSASGRCDVVFVVLVTSPLEGATSDSEEVAPDESPRDGTVRVVRGGATQTCVRADNARQQEA